MKLRAVSGPNFSGRTALLREWVSLPNTPTEDASYNHTAYVGLDAANYFSGIAATCSTEIDLLAADDGEAVKAKVVLERLGLGHCLSRNPFTLSGGEQVVVAIICAAAGRPRRLAIDCAFEQLSSDMRALILTYLGELEGDLLIADNRLDEWYLTDVATTFLPAKVGAPAIQSNPRLERVATVGRLEIKDLCFSYRDDAAVFRNFNAVFESGKPYLITGPNGSGKTTLAKILCGLLIPQSGEICVDGKPIAPWRRPGRTIGYSFQDPSLQMFETTVAAQLGTSQRSRRVAERFGVTQILSKHPLELPYALAKRVAMGSTLARGYGLSIFDEPTLGQDNDAATQMRAVLEDEAHVVISHSKVYSNWQSIELSASQRAAHA